MVLFVNFPLLSTLSKGYTVCLADTPGFGEHAEVVECGAKESMRSSAAYIYLLEIGTVGSESNAKSLKYLSEVDESKYIVFVSSLNMKCHIHVLSSLVL